VLCGQPIYRIVNLKLLSWCHFYFRCLDDVYGVQVVVLDKLGAPSPEEVVSAMIATCLRECTNTLSPVNAFSQSTLLLDS
jgi:hypothetical protein